MSDQQTKTLEGTRCPNCNYPIPTSKQTISLGELLQIECGLCFRKLQIRYELVPQITVELLPKVK